MSIAPEDTSPDEPAALLGTERARLEAEAAASRQRLARLLSDLGAAIGPPAPGMPATNGNGSRRAVHRVAEPPPAPSLLPTAPVSTRAPDGTFPAAASGSDRRIMARSRILLAVGVVALVFCGYQRWFTPWVAQNGQARLRSQGAPTLVAPKIDLDVAIGESTGKSSLRRGPGHDRSSAALDEAGNIVIAGHRSSYGGPFRRLNRLKRGDRLILDAGEPVEFRVESVKTGVPARDRMVRAQRGVHRLTLVTGAGNKRTVVVAGPVEGSDGKSVSADAVDGGGPLWPANMVSALFFSGIWAAAGVGLPLAGWLGRRWGRAITLLAVVPAGLVVAVGMFDRLEGSFGPLY